MHNPFTIPDQRVRQSIPWKLQVHFNEHASVFPGLLFPRVGLPGWARQAVRRAWEGYNWFSGSVEFAAGRIGFFGEPENKLKESVTLAREQP
jgi:hypothetical protein